MLGAGAPEPFVGSVGSGAGDIFVCVCARVFFERRLIYSVLIWTFSRGSLCGCPVLGRDVSFRVAGYRLSAG